MKIEFDVPEWALGRHIYIFAGAELLGKKETKVVHEDGKHVFKYLPIKIKPADGRCNRCGNCCESTGFSRSHLVEIKRALHGFKDYDGACAFLTDEGCLLGARIPFSCLRSVCTGHEDCSEKLMVVD